MNLSQQALQTDESFFQIRFWNFGRKPKNIWMNSEALILIKVHCVIYQWIRLNKLYKLMERFFFQISESFFELG